MLDAALDLFLGSRCAGCDRPGRMLCAECRCAVPATATRAWPDPVPPGLVTPWALAAHAGVVRDVVVGHKDRGEWGHRPLLGTWLARSVRAATASVDPRDPVVLVPVPSRPGATRRRGHDALGAVVRAAVRELRRERLVAVAPLLVSRGGVDDQRGLGADARAVNVSYSMWCPDQGLRRLRRRFTHCHVLLCDDVITTGATLREAQRAMTEVGLAPIAVAVVAATGRRTKGLEVG